MLNVPKTSDVILTLDWTGADGFVDLDMYLSGAVDEEEAAEGNAGGRPEMVKLTNVQRSGRHRNRPVHGVSSAA